MMSPLPYLSFFRKENWLQKAALLTQLCSWYLQCETRVSNLWLLTCYCCWL